MNTLPAPMVKLDRSRRRPVVHDQRALVDERATAKAVVRAAEDQRAAAAQAQPARTAGAPPSVNKSLELFTVTSVLEGKHEVGRDGVGPAEHFDGGAAPGRLQRQDLDRRAP